VFERATRRYSRPDFGITRTRINGRRVQVHEEVVWQSAFCRLLRFRRHSPAAHGKPPLLLVAPMSGHFATLLRGTVKAFLPQREVYITDWQDAREVPLSEGQFDLDDYIDTIAAIFRRFEGNVHVFACATQRSRCLPPRR
jgi:poly(3-hydroxybutyrate) depolymerase